MNKPVCYLLTAVIYDICLLNAREFYLFDFAPALFAFLLLSERRVKILFWLSTLNIFVCFIVVSYVLNGDLTSAKAVFVRTNLILLLTLSLFFGKDQYFLAKALYALYAPQKLIAAAVISGRSLRELLERISKIPDTLKIRGVKIKFSIFTYRAYANIIGKIIVEGFDKSSKIYDAMNVRGYKGHIGFLDIQRAEFREFALLALTLLAAGVRIYGLWE